MAFEQAPFLSVQNNLLRIKHPDLEGAPRTYLSVLVAASGTTLTVLDNAGFLSANTNSEFALLGDYENERTEFSQVTADPAAGSTIAVSALTFSHPIDTPVTLLRWNQIEIYGNSTNTTTGATLIATIAITVDSKATEYNVTGTTYNFYFARFRNSLIPRTSAYSDGVAEAGYDPGARQAIKKRALNLAGASLDHDGITEDFLNEQIRACEYDIQARSNKWNFLRTDNFTAPISLVQGQRTYALPTTIINDNSNDSIIFSRIDANPVLLYVYPDQWEEITAGITADTLAADVAVIDVTITLTDSGSFEDSGTIRIGNDDISYTANNRTTNVLSGVTGITDTHTTGDEVYQNGSFGLARYYTVKAGNILIHPIASDSEHQRNLYIEFYRTLTPMDSDGDVTAAPFFEAFDYWLLRAIALRRRDFATAQQWELRYEKKMQQALFDHVLAEKREFSPALANPQEQNYLRGRILTRFVT